jgi:S-formylglutathione hydrolase
MGGHGALTWALRHPQRFSSASAFSPICAPTQVPWGQKAFTGYLGGDQDAWREHDACALIEARGSRLPLLVDQGSEDPFLETQLRPRLLVEACARANVALDLRMRPGYDHSYFFVATFVADHLRHHARALHGG